MQHWHFRYIVGNLHLWNSRFGAARIHAKFHQHEPDVRRYNNGGLFKLVCSSSNILASSEHHTFTSISAKTSTKATSPEFGSALLFRVMFSVLYAFLFVLGTCIATPIGASHAQAMTEDEVRALGISSYDEMMTKMVSTGEIVHRSSYLAPNSTSGSLLPRRPPRYNSWSESFWQQ